MRRTKHHVTSTAIRTSDRKRLHTVEIVIPRRMREALNLVDACASRNELDTNCFKAVCSLPDVSQRALILPPPATPRTPAPRALTPPVRPMTAAAAAAAAQ